MLTKLQRATLAKHKKHHTAKHMAFMRKEMNKGKTFTQAHTLAMKKVGKWVYTEILTKGKKQEQVEVKRTLP